MWGYKDKAFYSAPISGKSLGSKQEENTHAFSEVWQTANKASLLLKGL